MPSDLDFPVFIPKLKYCTDNAAMIESVCMSAIYFDTRDSILARSGMSLRIRREGEHSVLSIKNKGITENGLHRRDENNMPYTGEVDENTVFRPDRDMLAESELGSRLLKLIDDRDLYPIIHMNCREIGRASCRERV